jgi:hypothetical protein
LHKTGRIDLLELGNHRHLAQEAPGVDPPLLNRVGEPGHLNGPPKLGLDALEELLDHGGGVFGL